MIFRPDPKPVTFENPDYLKWIRSRPCWFSGCSNKSEPHHIRRSFWGSGTGKKPHDYVAVPSCRTHHKPEYEEQFQVERIIIQNLMEYIESKRRVSGSPKDIHEERLL